jgi:transcriptional regulator with XRE-family HTH domain
VIGRQIQAVRYIQRPSISQQQLADKLEVTQATVTRMESGERAFTVGEVFQIAAVLNVAPGDLLAGAFTEEDVPITESIKVSPSVARGWIEGVTALPGADEDAYFVLNIPPSRARAIYGRVRMEIQAELAGAAQANRDAGAAAAEQRAAEARKEAEES